MLLTITTTYQPATDLGYLLHKNPASLHTRTESYGTAHVFYAEASAERCTAVLLLEIDPIGLVRNRRGPAGDTALLAQYVNDRPYAASSLLCVAMAGAFREALNGRSAERPELASTPLPLEFHLPVLPCRGGEGMLRALFEPLGYVVDATPSMLDESFPSWGNSPYFSVRLRITATLQSALTHLYVLIPVLDNDKHYWVGEAEVDKLLQRGEPWLNSHPQRDLVVRRYLKYRRSLADMALERLLEASDEGDVPDAPERSAESGQGEQTLERELSLNEIRLETVAAMVKALGATSLIDLGCGEGRLLRQVLAQRGLSRVTGVDVSHRALEIARDRLNVDRLPKTLADKLTLVHGSLTYRDTRFEGYDVATVIEVVEHLDPARLEAFERVLFEYARPNAIILTTPNREYNVKFPSLPPGRLRHSDHRFEWSRAEFMAWANNVAGRFGYTTEFHAIGMLDAELGAPTQMAVFSLVK